MAVCKVEVPPTSTSLVGLTQLYVYVPIISSFKIHGFPSNFQMVDIEYTNFPLPKICWSIKQPSLGIGSLKTANIFIFYFYVYECTYYVVI